MKWTLLHTSILALGTVLYFNSVTDVLAMDANDSTDFSEERGGRRTPNILELDEEDQLRLALEASRADRDAGGETVEDEQLRNALEASIASHDVDGGEDEDEHILRAIEDSRRTEEEESVRLATELSLVEVTSGALLESVPSSGGSHGAGLSLEGTVDDPDLAQAFALSMQAVTENADGVGILQSEDGLEEERERLERLERAELRAEQEREYEAALAEDQQREAADRLVEQRREALAAVIVRVQEEHDQCDANYDELSRDQELVRELRLSRFASNEAPSQKRQNYEKAGERARFLQGKLAELESLNPEEDNFFHLLHKPTLDKFVNVGAGYTAPKSVISCMRFHDPINSQGWAVTPGKELTFTFRIESDESLRGFGYALTDQNGGVLHRCEKQIPESGQYKMTGVILSGTTHVVPMIYSNLTGVSHGDDVSFKLDGVEVTQSDEG